MLVLSRHVDESIIIGEEVVVTVVSLRGDKVRLGIAAPIELPVHRQEVYDAIARERRGLPARTGARHCDAHQAMRDALRLVVGRLGGEDRAAFLEKFTAAERGQIEAAMAGGGRVGEGRPTAPDA